MNPSAPTEALPTVEVVVSGKLHPDGMEPCSSITFSCGAGCIKLSLRDGSVEFFNCDPAESGRAFWEWVTRAFPDFKKSIAAA